MNTLLERIFTNNMVETVDNEKISLGIDHIPVGEGLFLQHIINTMKPVNSLEVGFAYGISTLFICESLKQVAAEKHIVIDPFQKTRWKGIGIKNIREAGYEKLVEYIEEPSELALPNLLRNKAHFDFVFIDGYHTFDQVLLDFYYANRMLNLNGIIAFDDVNWSSIYRVCCYVSRYPCYRVHSYWPEQPTPIQPWLQLGKAIYHTARMRAKMGFIRNDLVISQRRCVAFQKVNKDERNFDWFQDF